MKPVKRGPWAVFSLLMLLAPGLAMGQYVLGTTTTTVASDAASNYSDAEFSSSTNKGSGFSGWTLDAATPNGGFAGRFVGSSAIAASTIDTDSKSFGLFANSATNATSGATRAFGRSLKTGDSFTISVAVNFRDGSKGFDLRNSSNSNIVNLNVGSDTYVLAGTTLFSNTYDANTVFTFTFSQNATSLDWTVNRSGGLTASQSGTISNVNSGTLTNIRLYNVSAGSSNDGADSGSPGARNLYFNSLSITSKHSIPSGETSTLSGDYTAPYVEIQSGGTLDLSSHTLYLSSGAILTNNGTFTGGTGTIDFLGTGTIAGSSAITLNNAILRGGVKLANSTINGVLTIATGGFVDDASISHSFGSSSTLRYANNDTYGANKEWRSGEASGVGVPANVEVNGTSIVSFGSSTTFRATGGLNVAPTAGITMSTLPGGDLKVSGNVTLNGTLTDNDRAVFFIGGEDQFLGKSTGDAILSIPYIIIDKDDNSDRIHLSNTALRITRKLTLTRGRLDPNNGSVTLVSDASHSASIDASGTGDIMSTFHVQRHIARTTDPVGSQVLLGSPLPAPFTGSSAGLLSNVWTQGATTGANVTNGNPNVFSYNESNGMTGWAAVANLATPTDRGKGYLVGLFKDDVAGGEVDGGWPKTLSVTGSWQASENDGSTVTLPVGFTSDVGESLDQRGWNLVSNPFISSIDWNAESGWTRTNIENWYQSLKEDGTFQGYNHATDAGFNSGSQFIAPFQGFWVKANAADPVLTVTDAIKAPDNQQSLNKSSDTPAFWIELTDDL